MRSGARFLVSALALLALTGCVYVKAVPIGNNTWVMESDGRGALGANMVLADTLRDAATLALSEGYGHFLLVEAPETPVDIGVRAVLYGSTRSVTYASDLQPPPPGAPAGEAAATVPADPTARTRVGVVMLRKNDPRIPRAYSALSVLAANP